MKKFLFSSLTVAFTITLANAQQMNYYPDMVGSPGQAFVLAEDTSPVITDLPLNIGTVGAGVVWNFQGLDFDKSDTINFMTPSGQQMIDFPSGNLVMENNAGQLVFDKDPANGLFLEGASFDFGGFPLALNYVPSQQWLPSVAGLGSSASTVSEVNEKLVLGLDTMILGFCHIVLDTIQLKRHSDYTVNFDATGELRLPLDTFAYTIRAISSEITVDSIFIYCPIGIDGGTCFGISAPVGWSLAPDALIQLSGFAAGAVVNDSTYTASWYYPYTISPICIVDFNYDSAYADTNFTTARFKGNNTPDIGIEPIDQILLALYPNPATNVLMLQTNADISKATMFLYNAQGQLVRTVNMNGSNSIDVSALANGVYFYQLGEGNKMLHHGKFIVKK